MTRHKMLLAPVTALALGLLGGVAHATTELTYTNTSNQSVFDSSGNYAFTLPTFDTTLGTLTGVNVSLGSFSTTYFEVFNVGSTAGTGVGNSVLDFTLTGPSSTDVTAAIPSGTQTVSVPGGFGNISSGSGGPIFATNSQTFGSTAFAPFETGSPASYTLHQVFTTTGSVSPSTPNATLAFGGSASEDNQATVTYAYTPNASAAPEPSQVGMLAVIGLSLGGLLLRARVSKSRMV